MSKYCPLPHLHLNLKQEGKVSACWRYPDRLGDYRTQSLNEIWSSSKLSQLRTSLDDGVMPEGCRSCRDMESSGIKSTRQQALEDYKDFTPNGKIQSIEIRFDNICNLMCRHCSPDYSSKWEAAVKKDTALLDKMTQYGTYRKSEKHISLTDEIIDEVISLAPNLKEILIAGGEPLYHDKHYNFIQRLLPYAENIKLSYNTNLTTLEYKGKSILDLWKKFKKVEVRVSIDGDPSCYSYVRTNNNLNAIEQNLFKVSYLKNVILSATCTTSMLNITRFADIVRYFNSLNVRFHASIVQYPECLNPKGLPDDLKDKVTFEFAQVLMELKDSKYYDKIKVHGQKVINYMNSDTIDIFDEFLDYASTLDKHHNTDLLTVYPEFKPFASGF